MAELVSSAVIYPALLHGRHDSSAWTEVRRSALRAGGSEPDEVVVKIHVHGLACPVRRVVRIAGAPYAGGAPLPLECVAVRDGEVSRRRGPRRVVIRLHIQVELRHPEPGPAPL